MSDDSRAQDQHAAAARVGEVVLGRYQIEAVLGVGGIGVLFRGINVETGEIVALKTLRPAYLGSRTAPSRFLREARIAMKLRHAAIPRGFAVGVDRGQVPVLVMELVSGRDFARILKTFGPLPVPDALRAGARVTEALDAAHRMAVVHRDIKPENIMLLAGAEIPQGVCVLDFGIAFCADEPRFTAANSLLGTPSYMSPEQARGETVTPASDLYALGATLVELITGRTLYLGSSMEQITGHASRPIPDWHERGVAVPEPVVRMVNLLLQKDPTRRPANAAVVGGLLGERARWCADPVAQHATADTYQVFASATGEAQRALAARVDECNQRLHRAMQSAAEAQGRLVRQLVEIAARRMERARLETELVNPGASVETVTHARQSLATLGVASHDGAREAALESALARLQENSLREQAQLVATIRELQGQLPARQGG